MVDVIWVFGSVCVLLWVTYFGLLIVVLVLICALRWFSGGSGVMFYGAYLVIYFWCWWRCSGFMLVAFVLDCCGSFWFDGLVDV